MFGFYLCVVEKLFNLGIIFWKVNIVFGNGLKRKMVQVYLSKYYFDDIFGKRLKNVYKLFILILIIY